MKDSSHYNGYSRVSSLGRMTYLALLLAGIGLGGCTAPGVAPSAGTAQPAAVVSSLTNLQDEETDSDINSEENVSGADERNDSPDQADMTGSRPGSLSSAGQHIVGLAVTLAGATAHVGCETPDHGQHDFHLGDPRIEGRVVDEQGLPVSGVTVRAQDRIGTTNEDGRYNVQVPIGWTGDIVVESAGKPADALAKRYLVGVDGDLSGEDFVIPGAVIPGPGPGQYSPPPNLIALSSSFVLEVGVAQVIKLSGRAGVDAPYEYIVTELPTNVTVVDMGNRHTIEPGELPYNLVNGGQAVQCTANAGFQVGEMLFRVTDGSNFSDLASVRLRHLGRHVVNGSVVRLDGSPIAGITVRLKGSEAFEGTDFETETDAEGQFAQRLPDGWQGILSLEGVAEIAPSAEIALSTEHLPETIWFTAQPYIIVASNGNSGAAGTISDPLNSIQEALNRALPGDIVYIRQGNYTEQRLTFARSGQPGAPIKVASYPGETATLTSGTISKPVFDFTKVWDGNHQAGFGHYVFDRLKIHGSRHGWMIDFGYEGQPLATEQLKAIHDVVIRNCEIWNCESALKTRNAGIRGLMVSDTHVHGCVGTEGGWDFGEWPDDTEAILIPGSASRNIEFVRCDSYENNFIQQANGWVFQPCVSNVTFRQCRAWNNGKYGFACKGSGGFRLDRCAAWGNSSTQMYCRGMATLDDGTPRPPYVNDFVLTNCVFLAPADQRGGAALNIRENASVAVYHCTIVGLRDASYGESGGYALLQGQHHEVTSELSMYNSIAVGYTDAQAVRMFDAHAPSDQFMCYTSYKGDRNLYFAQTSTAFKYQKKNWPSVDGWRAYFAAGEPQGDNQENGPMQSFADEYSLYQEPGFQDMSPDDAPLVLAASNDFLNDHMDVRPGTNSPALSAGQNLAPLQISELQFDYLGNPRPTGTPATIGAFNGSGGSSVSGGI